MPNLIKHPYSEKVSIQDLRIYPSMLDAIIPILSPGMTAVAEAGDSIESGDDAIDKLIEKTPERINNIEEILSGKSELSHDKEREELSRNIVKLAYPIGFGSYKIIPRNELYEKENLTPDEKEELKYSSYSINILDNSYDSSRVSPEVEKLFLSTMPVIIKALERIKTLMPEKEKVQVFIIDYFINELIHLQNGFSRQKVALVDPFIRTINLASFTVPEKIDREKTPIVEGKTKHFTIDEIYEKRDIFPFHKVKEAQVKLGKIWNEYMLDLQKNNGFMLDEVRQAYWDRINNEYIVMETITNSLIANQKADPTFSAKNMRIFTGNDFDDVVSGPRSNNVILMQLNYVREAQEVGWPLHQLWTYCNIVQNSDRIAKKIDVLRTVANKKSYADYVKAIAAYKDFVDENIKNKPYEKNPAKRAVLLEKLERLENEVYSQHKILLVNYEIQNKPGFSEFQETFEYSIRGTSSNFVTAITEMKQEAYLESIQNLKNRVTEGVKRGLISSDFLNENFKYLENQASAIQKTSNYMDFDNHKIEERDIQINNLMDKARSIEACLNGTEYTLQGKSKLSKNTVIEAFRHFLKGTDSLFHCDSNQFKAIKDKLEKLSDGTLSNEDKRQLTFEVKKWLTDSKHNRSSKHTKNDFDNTRFNVMFGLANELDPDWARENFSLLNISGLHGKNAEKTKFHHMDDFMTYIHKKMADDGYLPSSEEMKQEAWYSKGYSKGVEGIVAEVEKLYKDPSYSDKDRMFFEHQNISKLETKDNWIAQEFPKLSAVYTASGIYSREDFDLSLIDKADMQSKREEAEAELRTWLNAEANKRNPKYEKVLAAYSIINVREANEIAKTLRGRKAIDLSKLEKKHKLDFAGRNSARRKNKIEMANRHRKNEYYELQNNGILSK